MVAWGYHQEGALGRQRSHAWCAVLGLHSCNLCRCPLMLDVTPSLPRQVVRVTPHIAPYTQCVGQVFADHLGREALKCDGSRVINGCQAPEQAHKIN
jgi:hypothetical protein